MGAYAVEFVKQKHLGGWNIKKAVEFACKASARTIEKVGALETIPWADEVGPDLAGSGPGHPRHAGPDAPDPDRRATNGRSRTWASA